MEKTSTFISIDVDCSILPSNSQIHCSSSQLHCSSSQLHVSSSQLYVSESLDGFKNVDQIRGTSGISNQTFFCNLQTGKKKLKLSYLWSL